MKKLGLLIIFTFILSPVTHAQYEEVIDVSDALQNALDVRTSAVKIVKDYLYKGLKVNYVFKENDENLSKGETSMLKLEIYAHEHPSLISQVNKVKQQWKKLRVLAIHQPKKEKMNLLVDKLNQLLTATNTLIEEIKKTDDIKIINYQHASNEMEVLAQQLAFLYALKVAGLGRGDITGEIEQKRLYFQKNLDATFFSGENTLEITEALKSIQADWEMVKKSVNNIEDNKFLNTIYILMNKISKEAKKAALLYQEKAKNELKEKQR